MTSTDCQCHGAEHRSRTCEFREEPFLMVSAIWLHRRLGTKTHGPGRGGRSEAAPEAVVPNHRGKKGKVGQDRKEEAGLFRLWRECSVVDLSCFLSQGGPCVEPRGLQRGRLQKISIGGASQSLGTAKVVVGSSVTRAGFPKTRGLRSAFKRGSETVRLADSWSNC